MKTVEVEAPKGSAKSPKVIKRVEIERAANGGHVVTHKFHNGGMNNREPEVHTFGESEGGKLIAHLSKHLGIKGAAAPAVEEEE